MLSNSGFLRAIDFLMELSFSSQDLRIIKGVAFGIQKAGKRLNTWFAKRKVTPSCAMQTNGAVGAYYFYDQKFTGMYYYQMLHPHVCSEDQQLLQNAVFQQHEVCFHITLAVLSLSSEMFLESPMGRYGLVVCLAIFSLLSATRLFLLWLAKYQVYCTLPLDYCSLKEGKRQKSEQPTRMF